MCPRQSLPSCLSDRWRYALVGGLLALPFTAASYWQSGTEVSLGAVFWAGIAAGYLAKRRRLAGTTVGVRAGLVAALPGLWMAADLVSFLSTLGAPTYLRVVQVWMLVGLVAFLFGLSALLGGVGGRLGGWLAERQGHPRPQAVADG